MAQVKQRCVFIGGGPLDGEKKVLPDHIQAFRIPTLHALTVWEKIIHGEGEPREAHVYLREPETNEFWYEGID